jgi:hypothetical protein
MLHRTAPLYLSLVTAIVGCSSRASFDGYSGSSAATAVSTSSGGMSGGASSASYGGAPVMDSVASTPVRAESAPSSPVASRASTGESVMAVRRADASPVAPGMAGGSAAGMVAPTSVTVTTTTSVTTNVAPVVIEQQQTTAGLLTAATVGDHDRRNPYLEYLGRHPGERSMLRLDMSRRVRFRVLDGQGQPVNDAAITVAGAGAQVSGRSHADGFWDF